MDNDLARKLAHTGRLLLITLWMLVLLAPMASVLSAVHQWDVHPALPLAVSGWLFATAWHLLGQRLFLLFTWPLATLAAVITAADLLRGADLLELAVLRPAAGEVRLALGPYLAEMALVAALLAAIALAACRLGSSPRGAWRWSTTLLILAGTLLLTAAPAAALRAWPINAAVLVAAHASGRNDLVSTLRPYAHVDPREPGSSWGARRTGDVPDGPETYILVIGESVRADRLRLCGGRAGWAAPPEGLLAFCDMTSGSSSTHTSVPLLLSRELPGGPLRVSRDATFMKAFEEAGFRTVFLSVQERMIAWPDAREARFLANKGSDREILLDAAAAALRGNTGKLLLVVHTYGAHFDYCARLKRGEPPLLPQDCGALGDLPSQDARSHWLAAYDNAVHDSMLFLDALAAQTQARGSPVFMAYTSDHGENLFDDDRGLSFHALGFPTRWDTRVPLIVHANAAWRERNAAKWVQLQGNQQSALMHADVVPTLLGAAGIAYEDRRRGVTDLTAAVPGPRTRWVLRRLGHAVDADGLR